MSIIDFPRVKQIGVVDTVLEFLEQDYALKIGKTEDGKFLLDFDKSTILFDQEDMQEFAQELAEVAGLGWQTIESAPRDATLVLLLTTEGVIEGWCGCPDGIWVQGICIDEYSLDSFNFLPSDPTHWRPLPQAPKVKS